MNPFLKYTISGSKTQTLARQHNRYKQIVPALADLEHEELQIRIYGSPHAIP